MGSELTKHLEQISQKNPESRRAAMAAILEEEGLPCRLQEEAPSFKSPMGIKNFLVDTVSPETPGPLFGAHYDAVPGSSGANDNGAAVCLLIALAKSLTAERFPAHFAFFDGEESKCAGSKFYVSQLDRAAITSVLNLDMCGFGDTIAVYGRGHEKKAAVRAFCHKEILKKHDAQLVKYLPESDDRSFRGAKVATLSIAVVPRWDTQYLKALATYGDGFLGRPPEYEMILGEMEVVTTMHGGYRDAPSWIQPEALEKLYGYLWEGLHTPAPKKRFFFA